MTAPLAAVMAAAWTLIFVLGVWSVVGPYLRDRKPRRGGETRATTSAKGKSVAVIARPRRPCGAAGPRHRPPEIRAGGPQT